MKDAVAFGDKTIIKTKSEINESGTSLNSNTNKNKKDSATT